MPNQSSHPNQTQDALKQQDVAVVMVPFPAQGHLNQLLQLSRMILPYNIPIHYVTTVAQGRQAKLRVHGWDPLSAANIRFHEYEIPPFPSPPPNPNSKTRFPSHLQPCFDSTKKNLRQPVAALLHSLASKSRKVIVIHDSLMASVIQEVGLIPNAESYCFHSVSAFTSLMFLWHLKGNHEEFLDSAMIIPKNISIPSLEGCFSGEFLRLLTFEYEARKENEATKPTSGRIYDTCRVFESDFMDLLEKEQSCKHWALGPFNPVTTVNPKVYDNYFSDKGLNNGTRHFCLEWLDKQESNSVIYVSFGTTTSMKEHEIRALAIGLMKSDQKFIWVLRDADKGDVFKNGKVRRIKMPKGFEDSIKEKGLIVREWAPQLEILGHRATGGFLSHCGWNSCMESITMGVPIGAWPMHSDQPRNAVLITQILKIGVVVKEWRNGGGDDDVEIVVTADVVERGVRRLMDSKEGEKARKRVAELGEKVRRSVGEGGCSLQELDSFIAHISR